MNINHTKIAPEPARRARHAEKSRALQLSQEERRRLVRHVDELLGISLPSPAHGAATPAGAPAQMPGPAVSSNPAQDSPSLPNPIDERSSDDKLLPP